MDILAIYVAITILGFNRGIWANFRYDACYKYGINHYAAMVLYSVVWPAYLAYECAFSADVSIYRILRESIEYEAYVSADLCLARDDAMRRIHDMLDKY